ncbi:hypothetical protein FW778_18670 [Ginsengibacter hankyongi]|uniref:Colicin import membrane protein n=1 Tax=Ginsengibacter hankyongi TaxID=2607284 RepID=A0A5J5IE29_9BACT|nr:hypothetical protein [Ginsengibacter hankyongi]KAA9036637.1 hypothetical protein FW778_18670 [Ginsengibacter hankyongi]
MKQIMIALFFLAATLGFTNVNAQQKTTAKKQAKTTTVKAKEVTNTKKMGLKKDGTPDMRYKENKVTKTTTHAGPTKKDGTADMRYKANKTKTTKKTTTK